MTQPSMKCTCVASPGIPSSGLPDETRGTYAGLIEKIPYLQKLGVQIVELMPVHQYDRQSAPGGRPNYWGYEPVSYFAPHRGYSSRQDWLGPVDEFRDMVKALHRAGIEVILDVVYNHTAEDGDDGPTVSLRGIDNRIYYLLDPANRAQYIDDSGVGNTLNGNHTVVRRMILDSLRYWVQEMHVDGFRFDLASVLYRGQDNEVMQVPPLLWDIDSDPIAGWAPRSLPKPGMLPVSTKSVRSSATAGRSGTVAIGTRFAASSRAMPV